MSRQAWIIVGIILLQIAMAIYAFCADCKQPLDEEGWE